MFKEQSMPLISDKAKDTTSYLLENYKITQSQINELIGLANFYKDDIEDVLGKLNDVLDSSIGKDGSFYHECGNVNSVIDNYRDDPRHLDYTAEFIPLELLLIRSEYMSEEELRSEIKFVLDNKYVILTELSPYPNLSCYASSVDYAASYMGHDSTYLSEGDMSS